MLFSGWNQSSRCCYNYVSDVRRRATANLHVHLFVSDQEHPEDQSVISHVTAAKETKKNKATNDELFPSGEVGKHHQEFW